MERNPTLHKNDLGEVGVMSAPKRRLSEAHMALWYTCPRARARGYQLHDLSEVFSMERTMTFAVHNT